MEKYTITRVAKELGVSCATISRAINNEPGVGEQLRNKVLEYVEKVGYKPNNLAQGLSSGKMNFIGLILGDIRNPFYAELAFNIQKELNDKGYTVVVFNSEYDMKKEIEYIHMAKRLNFAGLILLTAQTKEIAEVLDESDIAIVMVNRILKGFSGSSVMLDNFKAGYIATMHLIGLGHKNIGFIDGQATSSASKQRYEGYCQALHNCQLSSNDQYYQRSDLKKETGYKIAVEFNAIKEEKPTAIVIVNDMTAIGFIDGFRKNKGHIPENISIVSFDDIPVASVTGIELTTVNQHVEEMSSQASRLMLKAISGVEESEQVIIDPTLIIRGSTKKYK